MNDAVVYRDEHLLVLNKPEGLLTTPGRFEKQCLWGIAKRLCPAARVVHRLDLDTSGLVVFGCTDRAVSGMNRLFRERGIDKYYDAVSFGLSKTKVGRIQLPLGPDRLNRPKQRLDWRGGKSAQTDFEVLDRVGSQSRLLLKPVSGVRHQLRLHLALIGLPIIGCDLYAPLSVKEASSRLMLHARALRFVHPVTGDPLTIDAGPAF